MAGVVNLDRDGRSSPCDTLSFILDVRPAPGLPDRWGGTPQGRYGLSPFFFYSSLYQYPGRQPWLLWSRPGRWPILAGPQPIGHIRCDSWGISVWPSEVGGEGWSKNRGRLTEEGDSHIVATSTW